MSDSFFGVRRYKDFTLPELRDLAVKRADAGVACQQSEGDSRDFIRKRTRAYHRAMARGSQNPEVIRFATKLAIFNMANKSIIEMYAPQIEAQILRPSGLMAWLKNK